MRKNKGKCKKKHNFFWEGGWAIPLPLKQSPEYKHYHNPFHVFTKIQIANRKHTLKWDSAT